MRTLLRLLLGSWLLASAALGASTATATADSTATAPADTSGYELEDLVVTESLPEREVTRQELSRDEIRLLPGFGGDAIKSVQALPGVARPSMFDQGAIVVRGSGQFDTRYYLDGIDIPLLFHYGGVKSTYNSMSLSSVDLYPGGFNTRYGGCVGGVVEIKGRPGRAGSWRKVVDVSLLDSSILAEGPLGDDFALLINARRSYAGEVVNAALSGNDDVSMAVVPYYWDLVGRLDWWPDGDDHLFLTVFAAKDRMQLIFPDESEGSSDVTEATDAIDFDLYFDRTILGWDRDFNPDLRNELRACYGNSNDSGHVFGFFRFRSEVPLFQLRDELSWRLSDRVKARAGLDMVWAPVDYEVEVVGWPVSLEKMTFSDHAAYANAELHLGDRLLLTPGLRYDRYRHLDEGEPSLRLTGRYHLNDAHTLTGAVGTYNQGPSPIGHSTDPIYGNPALPPTVATHVTLGDEWRVSRRLNAKVEAYYNTQDRIPAFTDSLDLNFLPDTDGRMFGLEMMLRYNPTDRFFGWLSYSLTRSERRYARRPGPDIEDWSPGDWLPFEYDQTHHLEAVGSWNLKSDWTVGGRLIFVSGNPVTPIRSYGGGAYEFDADTGSYVPVSGAYLSDRLDPYVRLDTRVERRFGGWGADWSLYLDVQNANYFVYNSPEGYVYNYDYSRRKEYGWIILPALGLKVEF